MIFSALSLQMNASGDIFEFAYIHRQDVKTAG